VADKKVETKEEPVAVVDVGPQENPYIKNEGVSSARQRVEEAKRELEEAKAALKVLLG